jgi:alkylhydroperoxidase/carboxymuconolactone decarboxylase family protein YurZ
VVNEEAYGVIWLQQAESKSQEEDLPGKTERTEEDALPERARTWLIIASKSAGDKVRVDPVESPEGAAGAAEEEALSVVVTAAAGVEDLALRQHLSMVCPRRRQ